MAITATATIRERLKHLVRPSALPLFRNMTAKLEPGVEIAIRILNAKPSCMSICLVWTKRVRANREIRTRMDNSNITVNGGHQGGDLVIDGWTDILRKLLVLPKPGDKTDPEALAVKRIDRLLRNGVNPCPRRPDC
jgi:hypothetical protein